jgi:predicted Zn-dependent protease
MPQDRIAQLEDIAQKSPYINEKDPAALQQRHDLVRAKIMAYTHQNNPQRILRQYTDNSLPSRYARAIVSFHSGGYQVAAPALNALIEAQPRNPWFHELKGTFLLESGKAKEAVGPLRKAVSLAPRSGYMRIELAQAMLESSGGGAEEALKLLRAALVDEDQSYLGYRLESQAYGVLGRVPEANLAAALASFHKGNVKEAKMLAERAKGGLAEGSPAWLKADDILAFKEVRG